MLQGLRGGADVVEMGLKRNDFKVAAGGWPILKRNLDRIIGLTLNMLAFSRPRRVELSATPLTPLIEECAQLLEPALASASKPQSSWDVDADLPPIPVDPPLLHQAIMNLLTNAVEAAPEGAGVVTVRVKYHQLPPAPAMRSTITGAFVELAVIDNGPGIPQSKQPWVFEPFNTTKGVKGTGLGLAVARCRCSTAGHSCSRAPRAKGRRSACCCRSRATQRWTPRRHALKPPAKVAGGRAVGAAECLLVRGCGFRRLPKEHEPAVTAANVVGVVDVLAVEGLVDAELGLGEVGVGVRIQAALLRAVLADDVLEFLRD